MRPPPRLPESKRPLKLYDKWLCRRPPKGLEPQRTDQRDLKQEFANHFRFPPIRIPLQGRCRFAAQAMVAIA